MDILSALLAKQLSGNGGDGKDEGGSGFIEASKESTFSTFELPLDSVKPIEDGTPLLLSNYDNENDAIERCVVFPLSEADYQSSGVYTNISLKCAIISDDKATLSYFLNIYYGSNEDCCWIGLSENNSNQDAVHTFAELPNDASSNTLILRCDSVEYQLDKTWQQIVDAIRSGKNAVVLVDYSTDSYTQVYIQPVTEVYNYNGQYYVSTMGSNGSLEEYIATAPNEKPYYSYNS